MGRRSKWIISFEVAQGERLQVPKEWLKRRRSNLKLSSCKITWNANDHLLTCDALIEDITKRQYTACKCFHSNLENFLEILLPIFSLSLLCLLSLHWHHYVNGDCILTTGILSQCPMSTYTFHLMIVNPLINHEQRYFHSALHDGHFFRIIVSKVSLTFTNAIAMQQDVSSCPFCILECCNIYIPSISNVCW